MPGFGGPLAKNSSILRIHVLYRLAQACAKDRNVKNARLILQEMWAARGLLKEGVVDDFEPRTWHYNCAIEAAAKAGGWLAACEIMRDMESHGESER